MTYGDKFTFRARGIDREWREFHSVYKRASWQEWHTNDEGDGLWRGDRQLAGTCDFTVRGCKTEKAAIAKVRQAAKQWMQD